MFAEEAGTKLAWVILFEDDSCARERNGRGSRGRARQMESRDR